MKTPQSNNFQTRIIKESKDKRENRIRNALIESGRLASQQMDEFGLTNPLKKNKVSPMNKKPKTAENDYSENAKDCLKFLGAIMAVIVVLLIAGKIWEHWK